MHMLIYECTLVCVQGWAFKKKKNLNNQCLVILYRNSFHTQLRIESPVPKEIRKIIIKIEVRPLKH